MPRTLARLLVPALALLLVTGCTVIPGSHFSGGLPGSKLLQRSDDPSLPRVVNVRPLSTGLLVQRAAEATPPELPEETSATYDYKVGPGDVLNITVWDHPELTIPAGSMRSPAESGNWVHADGSIFYPYVGRIEVAGLDVTEIRDLITRRISRYIENPQVDVTVAAFRSQRVYVTGAVRQPGALPVTNLPMRLLDAVNAVGGIDETADWRDVTLTRDGREYRLSLRALYQDGDRRHNVLLRDGDVVHVGSNADNKVFVMGEVLRPRTVPMERNGLSLANALAESGGISQLTGNASGVFVMRADRSGDEPRIDVFQLDARSAAALVLADQFELQPRDIVYVTAAPIARWNRLILQLLPTMQTIYYGALAEDRLRDRDD